MGKEKEKNKNWIDFKALKERVSMEMVLDHYGLLEGLKESGQNLVGCCPIHKGSNSRQFSVNLEKNLFNCFGQCKAGGNILDFVALMEVGDNDGMEFIRKAGLMIQDWFPTGEEKEPEKQEGEEELKRLLDEMGERYDFRDVVDLTITALKLLKMELLKSEFIKEIKTKAP